MTERTTQVPPALPLLLDSGLADLLRPELPSLADEIVEEIRLGVSEFARPLQGNFGHGLRLGVEEGLRQFVDQIADPGAPQDQSLKVYRALGRGEYLEGRSLDALQAAYRIASRLAVHPQTIRYRMRRLEELFGDRLHDPDWRFEMELVLRARALAAGQETAEAPGT